MAREEGWWWWGGVHVCMSGECWVCVWGGGVSALRVRPCVCVCMCVCERERERGKEGGREREKSELYYTRIKILGL